MNMKAKPKLEQSMQEKQIRAALNAHWHASAVGDGRVRLNDTAYWCFMMGPSATAEVEATLVYGAQGIRSLDILFLAPSGL